MRDDDDAEAEEEFTFSTQLRKVRGYNEFAASEPPSALSKLIDQLKEPLILLLLGSAVVSLLLGEVGDAVSIVLAVAIVVAVAHIQEQRSSESLAALSKLVPHYCHLVRDGVTSHVLANELVPGDIVTFSTGDRVPADVRIIESVQLETDESPLTGEIKPRRKTTDALGPSTSISERDNTAFMGTLVKSGSGRGVVVATGPQTEFGAIFAMVDEVVEQRTPLQLSMDDLAKKLSMASFAIIGVICLLGLWQRRGALEMFTIGVSLAVAAIPEGLPIVVTVTLALGVLRMSHRKAIVKRLPSVETLGSISVICSDKTGTLTTNKMTVCELWTLEDGKIDAKELPDSPSPSLARTLLVGNLCNNARRDEKGEYVGQATDVAMASVVRHDARGSFTRTAEMPFSSETKWMSVTGTLTVPPSAANIGQGSTTYTKGAVEAVLERAPHAQTAEIRRAADEMAKRGLRVLACAVGTTFCGLQAVQDPPRQGVRESIAELRRSGIQIIMITGDAEPTANAIARQVGIDGGASMLGSQIDSMSERQLQESIDRVSVFARTTPRHKMSIVRALQSNGHVVAMTGDGVNDAPALKLADIGIALGRGGSDVAKEASDVILVDDNFATILPAVEEGKGIFYNIQNFLAFQLSTAVAALSLITLSTAAGLKLPLNPMQILFINILMDGPPSQSLGVDPVDRAVVMRRRPRRKDAPVLTRRVLMRVLFSATIIVLGTLYIYVAELTDDGFADERDQTMTFTAFVFLDLTSAVQNRGLTTTLTGNRMLTLTVSVSLVSQLLLVYFPPLQGVFKTTSLGLGDLTLLVVIAGLGFAAHEGRRRWERQRADEEDGQDAADGWGGLAVA
ncbi:calcium-transporting P [Jaminaea rosea]|uniref:Calcium-transporting ATPase n=1 Tax=Jaminaea rosea TaxID=1569628 RepID=A0A316UYW9_9BASI|nr:calcium-transporting P [Jaminaea rosea]PWN29113.1 calcium-transporting P [Jaminaea rosea]